jgi:hypothetical protein
MRRYGALWVHHIAPYYRCYTCYIVNQALFLVPFGFFCSQRLLDIDLLYYYLLQSGITQHLERTCARTCVDGPGSGQACGPAMGMRKREWAEGRECACMSGPKQRCVATTARRYADGRARTNGPDGERAGQVSLVVHGR